MKFKKGDIVKTIDIGYAYPNFLRFLADNCHEIDSEVLAGFKYGARIDKSKEYKVVFSAHHPTLKQEVVVVFDGEHTFMLENSGLELVERIQVGDKVIVADVRGCFSTYQQFMLNHRTEMSASVFWNWNYNEPYSERFREDVDYGFRVVLIAEHHEQNRDVAVISNGKDTFLFNVHALYKVNHTGK